MLCILVFRPILLLACQKPKSEDAVPHTGLLEAAHHSCQESTCLCIAKHAGKIFRGTHSVQVLTPVRLVLFALPPQFSRHKVSGARLLPCQSSTACPPLSQRYTPALTPSGSPPGAWLWPGPHWLVFGCSRPPGLHPGPAGRQLQSQFWQEGRRMQINKIGPRNGENYICNPGLLEGRVGYKRDNKK